MEHLTNLSANLVAAAETAVKARLWIDAERAARAAAVLIPAQLDAHLVFAKLALDTGRLSAAARSTQLGMKLAPLRAEVWSAAAALAAVQGKPGEMTQCIRRALIASPNSDRGLRTAARVLRGRCPDWLRSVAPGAHSDLLAATLAITAGDIEKATSIREKMHDGTDRLGLTLALAVLNDDSDPLIEILSLPEERARQVMEVCISVLGKHCHQLAESWQGLSPLAGHYVGASLAIAQNRLANGDVEGFLRAASLVLEADETNLRAISLMLDVLTSTLDFREVENLVAGIEERLAHNPPTTSAGAMHLLYLAPFAALSQPVRRSLAALVERDLPLPEPAQVRARGRPLRIGYVSGHLGDHPVGHVMSGLFEAHDRNRVHVTVFCDQDRSYEQGEYFERVRDGVDQMVFIQDLDDDKAAARIRAEAIDILIDINGYMRPIRVGLFARRPAPVQIYWMGHGGALGLSCHDFVIGDRAVIDDAEAAGYRERVIRLPVSFHAADRQAVDAEVPTRVECGLPPEGHVLCAFNHPRKIDRMAANAWMQILRDIPGSVLWLSRGPFPERALQNLSALAQAHKVDPKRLILADRIQDKRRHLSRHRLASLFLDTFRFSASATGVDALLAGLPIVTRRGSSFHSNIGTSLVHAAGLPDLIAEDTEDYIRIACGLLRSPDRLAEVRSRLEDGRASTLFGTKRLARNLEDVFEAVSRRPVADQPRMIEIT